MGDLQTNEPSDAVLVGGLTSSTAGQTEASTGTTKSNDSPPSSINPPTGAAEHVFSSQLNRPASSVSPNSQEGGAFNMATMSQAMPQGTYSAGHYHRQGQHFDHNQAHLINQAQQMPHYADNPSMPVASQNYYLQQQVPMAPYYGHHPVHQSHSQHNMVQRQQIPYYSQQMMMGQAQPPPYYYAHSTHFQGSSAMMLPSAAGGQYTHTQQATLVDGRSPMHLTDGYSHASHTPPDFSEGVSRQSTVRGPPRKPRQSGHAIWIGNLPPQTNLMSLVHHVCREAPGLVSLFLISKSNCAFANFRDETTCIGAQQRLHDSRFQSVRLVSRLRRSTVDGPTGSPAQEDRVSTVPGGSTPIEAGRTVDSGTSDSQETGATLPQLGSGSGAGSPLKDKFFILKSLTNEDLELSVRTGIWATQSHNEDALNNAFKTADDVYLVFSANKSGEYFGYARMTSQINQDPSAAIEFAPKAQTSDVELPKAVPTEATEFAPKGRIIDDSARGTIFWEVERDADESGSETESDVASAKSGAEDGETKTWGKPFKLEWLCTKKLPFYRTRGLRNPWNSNREVKIARDGTELEPSAGRRLIGLFNRAHSPVAMPAGCAAPNMRPFDPGYNPYQPRPFGR